jgi:hypothetical protein
VRERRARHNVVKGADGPVVDVDVVAAEALEDKESTYVGLDDDGRRHERLVQRRPSVAHELGKLCTRPHAVMKVWHQKPHAFHGLAVFFG